MRNSLPRRDFDAVVVGAGPNGLAAAITIQQAGYSVLLAEAKGTVGGGLRSAQLTLPGFMHDVCSAIHPLAISSPFFNSLPLSKFGLDFVHSPLAAAHPFDDGSAAILYRSLDETAASMGADHLNYAKILAPIVASWKSLLPEILAPLHFPKHVVAMSRFGVKAMQPATMLANQFDTTKARGLWAGMAAHAMLPLTKIATSAVALVLLASGHAGGWPMIKGGSQNLARALADYFVSIGGKIETNFPVTSLSQLPSSHAVLFDITPRQLLPIAGHRFSSLYKWQLEKYRYGMGVFKIDWALGGPVPFTAQECRQSATVHIGNTMEEIVANEKTVYNGANPERPFVLFAQQSLFDSSRAPVNKHTAWGYCHVPLHSTLDMTVAIEDQVERFAPGFKDRILGRHTMSTIEMEHYNGNYIGGDINGGAMDFRQLFIRPALKSSPYRTSAKGIYICSSATPPGGGVHGMCGFHAAQRALKDIFRHKTG